MSAYPCHCSDIYRMCFFHDPSKTQLDVLECSPQWHASVVEMISLNDGGCNATSLCWTDSGEVYGTQRYIHVLNKKKNRTVVNVYYATHIWHFTLSLQTSGSTHAMENWTRQHTCLDCFDAQEKTACTENAHCIVGCFHGRLYQVYNVQGITTNIWKTERHEFLDITILIHIPTVNDGQRGSSLGYRWELPQRVSLPESNFLETMILGYAR